MLLKGVERTRSQPGMVPGCSASAAPADQPGEKGGRDTATVLLQCPWDFLCKHSCNYSRQTICSPKAPGKNKETFPESVQ